jgi:hypothetical protein
MSRRRAVGSDHIDGELCKFRRRGGEPVGSASRRPIFEHDGAPFHKTAIAQPLPERVPKEGPLRRGGPAWAYGHVATPLARNALIFRGMAREGGANIGHVGHVATGPGRFGPG